MAKGREIKLNKNFSLDLDKLIESRLLAQANSGGGKSWCIRRILEQSHGKVQQIVLDMEGEFATLREKHDYILAGKEGDTPADPRSAALLAKRLLELNTSAIIDLYELRPHERKRFVKLFLEAMINAPKKLWHPCLIVIDEAHIFAPEKGQSEALDAVIGICTLGRKRKFCPILATQRLSKLHKDAAAECNNKLIGRTGLDVDMKRASEELGFTTKEDKLSLRTLEPGEFYAFGTAMKNTEPVKVKIGDVKTTHAQYGDAVNMKVTPPTAKIKALLPKLEDLPKEAEEEVKNITEAKKQIANLKRELTMSKRGVKPILDEKMLEKRVEQATRQTEREWKQLVLRWEKYATRLHKCIDKIIMATSPCMLGIPPEKEVSSRPRQKVDTSQFEKTIPVVKMPEVSTEDVKLKAGARKILSQLIAKMPETLSKKQIGILTGFKHTGGTFNTYISTLKSLGLIQDVGGEYVATNEGMDFLGEVPKEVLPEELREEWRSKLKAGARKMFDVIVESYPNSVSKEELGDAVGFVPTGGTFNTYISTMRAAKIIEVDGGELRASDTLF